MKLSALLTAFAAHLLPDQHKSWGQAMQAEVSVIPDPVEANLYAVGCVCAALTLRTNVMKFFAYAGRLLVGTATAFYGLSFLYFLANSLLHRAANADLQAYMTFLVPWQAAMGVSHVAAAIYFISWRPRALVAALGAATLSALALFGLGILDLMAGSLRPDYPIIAFAWPLVPVAFIGAAAMLIAQISRRRVPATIGA